MGSSMSESEPVDNSSTTSYPPQSNHRPIDELFEDEPLPDTVPNDFRDAVFKAGYHYVSICRMFYLVSTNFRLHFSM